MDAQLDTRLTEDGIPVLSLTGDVECGAAEVLRASLKSLDRDGHHSVVVDFSAATHVDSSTLGVLIDAMRRARGEGGDVFLSAPGPHFRRALEITRLSRVFPVVADTDAALAALRARKAQTAH